MKRRVRITSANGKKFLLAVIDLVQKGATLPEDSGVFKGAWLRTELEIDASVEIERTPVVQPMPIKSVVQEKEGEDVTSENLKEEIKEVASEIVKEGQEEIVPPKAVKKAAKKASKPKKK